MANSAKPNPLWYALVGALAGGRTTAAAVFTTAQLRRNPDPDRTGLARAMGSDGAATAIAVGVILETIVDKLPGVGDRTAVVGVGARAVSGALAGAALSSADDRNPVLGALLGSTGAIAATFALFHLRDAVHRRLGVPNLLGGLGEDALLLGLGRLALRG